MKPKELTPQQIQNEFSQGKAYKESINLYDKVKINNRFYEGDQWNGVKVLRTKPLTMNFLRRLFSYFTVMVVSDDVDFELKPFNTFEGEDTAVAAMTDEIKRIIERCKLKVMWREGLRDAGTNGDAAVYHWWNPDKETGRGGVQGEIESELLMNTNVIFGNSTSSDVQSQPYIIIVRRRPVQTVREEARLNGVKDWEQIREESGSEYVGEEEGTGTSLVTELTRFWKQDKRVHFMTVCGDVVTKPDTPTEMQLYPISYWSWLPKRNACHGVRPMDELINTQIAVNRLWSAVVSHIENLAFPKLVYDATKFPKGWDATPGKAVAVQGAVDQAVTGTAGGVQLSTQVTQILELIVSTARDFSGASDVALGNISNPDNTSAIIATQEATAAPLQMQKFGYYQFVEDELRVFIDMIHAYYGIRQTRVTETQEDQVTGQQTEQESVVDMDFSSIPVNAMDLNVEVGASSYWSTLVQTANADKLLNAQIITNPVEYLKRLPDGVIKDKQGLISDLQEQISQQASAQMAQTLQVPMQQGLGM